MPTGQEYVFYYTVKIPNGLEFNQTAFSHHGVYFSLDTEDGKYRTQTEPNKIGLRIAEKYNLELTKYQIDKDKVVAGASYSVQEIITNDDGTETRGESKTGVTNAQGQLTITNLYAEKIYELREIKTPDDYELNSNVIRFIGHVDDEGTLTIEKTGETREDPQIIKENGEDYKVTIQVEDEVKASVKLVKKEQGTDTLLEGVRYKLTGYNLPETGKTIRTNTNGEATIKGISINQEYTLEEVKADGYYLASPIKFKIVNNNGSYEIQVTEGMVTEQSIIEENYIPTVNFTLEDEKIPTYNLQLFKIKKTTESTLSTDELIAKAETDLAGTEVVPLANATFKLFKGNEELGKYTTDEQGYVTIEGLYQYESEKDIDQTYTLKEVMAPEGYAKVQDISFRVQKDEESDQLILINESGEDSQYSVDGNTVTLVIEDSPSFKLIKKDAETQQTLANIKFAIFNVDDGTEQPARNSKGEIIGTKETINGREYYTVQTDSNGELTADLPEGLYKAVEVEAPEQYDISNQDYYFGIGASREAPTEVGVTQATSIGGSDEDQITSVAATSDGGYVAGGYFNSDSFIVGDYTLTLTNNSGVDYKNDYYYDGMVIKYGADGEVEWATSIGGSGEDAIISVAETSDGGIIAGGYFESDSITVGDYTLTNAGDYADGIVIKYGADGEVKWISSTRDSYNDEIQSVAETSDGGFIVGGTFVGSIIVGNYTLTAENSSDAMVIRYGVDGEVKWATSIGGRNSDDVSSVAETSDGGIVVVGYSQSDSIIIGDYTLTKVGVVDSFIIKFDSNGEVEWANSMNGTDSEELYSVSATSDGGIVVGGEFNSDSITVGDVTLTNNSSYFSGILIKFGAEGKVEWTKVIGGGTIGGTSVTINSVAETSDGGIIIGGYFLASLIVGDNTLKSYGAYDGMIIKYGADGELSWVKRIGETDSEVINSVSETSNGGIIAGGYFESPSISVGNPTITNAGNEDGMVIKYEKVELNNPTTIQAQSIGESSYDSIESLVATRDGGYIAGGYFCRNITVGGYTLINAGNRDGMVIKYGADGEVKWATSIGGNYDDYINSVAVTSDGEIIVAGYFKSTSITVGGYTLTNAGENDGIIIKYGADGEVKWATSIAGSGDEFIESVAATSDGDIVVGGCFFSSSITVGDYTLKNSSSNTSNEDGMVIRYGADGEVKWATSVGGSSMEELVL